MPHTAPSTLLPRKKGEFRVKGPITPIRRTFDLALRSAGFHTIGSYSHEIRIAQAMLARILSHGWFLIKLRTRAHMDLEMHSESNQPEDLKTSGLLENALGANSVSHPAWPGLRGYLNRLDEQITAADAVCFTPLWKIFRFKTPVAKEDLLDFINNVAVIFQEHWNDGLSIDDILQSLLDPFRGDLDRGDAEAQNLSRQAVFKVISWLTTIFETSNDGSDCSHFKIEVPIKWEGIRDEQSIEMAKRPLSKLVQGFGHLVYGDNQILGAVEQSKPDILRASSLNISSLKRISKIQVKWTDALGYHLMFDPLSRTILIYRFPTICAVGCMTGGKDSILDMILRECYPTTGKSAPVLAMYKREVLLSYRLLFGQHHASRRYFSKVERSQVVAKSEQYDQLLDLLCGQSTRSCARRLPSCLWPESCQGPGGRLIKQDTYSTALDFPILGRRLLCLQAFDERQQPARIRDLWLDRRNPLQWYAFWAVLIIGGLTIVLALLQLVVATLQLRY